MTNRRDFLRGATLTALPLAAGLSLPAGAGAGVGTGAVSPSAVPTILVDPDVEASRAFGAELAARGAALHALDGYDLTALWLGTLQPQWRRAPSPVAGLTRPSALFVLEQLAWPLSLRVVYHAEHVVDAAGRARHHVHRDAAALAPSERQLDLLDSLWPDRIAELVASYAATDRPRGCGPSCAGLEPRLPAGAELLASWIIAPV